MKVFSAGAVGALVLAGPVQAALRGQAQQEQVVKLWPDAVVSDVVQKQRSGRRLAAYTSDLISQTYYVPLPEELLMNAAYNATNFDVQGPVHSLISITVSTANTIVWYDEWEDGYEVDATKPSLVTTQVWGDGIAANGCIPGKSPCTDADDIFHAGETIVLENDVPLPRDTLVLLYDGKDRIQSTFPIAVTRSLFPQTPGTIMGEAVEVHDTHRWGTTFTAPLGEDIAQQYAALFYEAMDDGTRVTLPDGSVVRLNEGQVGYFRVKQGHTIKSNKNLQVDLVTAEIGTALQIRWFSMLPVSDWSSSYFAPVGSTLCNSRVVMYNPGKRWINITLEDVNGSKDYYWIQPNNSAITDVIQTGSGAYVSSDQPFAALLQTDASSTDEIALKTDGQGYGWGFPLLPAEMLTPQVLIGWSPQCAYGDCSISTGHVHVAPVAAADIYVDFNNDGKVDATYPAKRLESLTLTDSGDRDMSGAVVFATKAGSGPEGPPVNIAASWVQSPTGDSTVIGHNLGTIFLPFASIQVTHHAKLIYDQHKDGEVTPGDKLRFYIRVVNVGQTPLPAGTFTIAQPMLDQVTYLSQTTTYSVDGTKQNILDNAAADQNPFPLAGKGLPSVAVLSGRGGVHEIAYDVVVVDGSAITSMNLTATGFIQHESGKLAPFSLNVPLGMHPSLQVMKSIYTGHDGWEACDYAKKSVYENVGTPVTICYYIKNTGNTYLRIEGIADNELPYADATIGRLAPEEAKLIAVYRKVDGTLDSTTTVRAIPIFESWERLPGFKFVLAQDNAAIYSLDGRALAVASGSKIDILKTVAAGTTQCDDGTDTKQVSGHYGDPITFCYKITNTGITNLENIIVTDPALSYKDISVDLLFPGQTVTLVYPTTISLTLRSAALVTADVQSVDGVDPVKDSVQNSDRAEVDLVYVPSILLQKSVHLGNAGVASCTGNIKSVSGVYGSDVTYCYNVTNTGDTHLTDLHIEDKEINFETHPSDSLAPGESVVVSTAGKITVNTMTTAVARASPITVDGVTIDGLKDPSSSDNAGVVAVYNPSVRLTKTLQLGAAGACNKGKTSLKGPLGATVTVCYKVTNTGSSFLYGIVVDDTDFSYLAPSPKLLAPGDETVLSYTTVISASLSNPASVTATPVLANVEPIPSATSVAGTADASLIAVDQPGATVEKGVMLGTYDAATCETSDKNLQGSLGATVTFCYTVTNVGTVPLTSITIADADLLFTSPVPDLQPAESKTIAFVTQIQKDVLSEVVVTATPSTGGTIVTDRDSAGVTVVTSRMLQAVVEPTNCMTAAWNDAGQTTSLQCTTNAIFLEPTSIATAAPVTCEKGDVVTLTIQGSMRLTNSFYDVGWYTALDGGDGLSGTCAVDVLTSGNTYSVVKFYGSAASGGSVSWVKDSKGGNDECGDVTVSGNAVNRKANIMIPIITNKSVKCTDSDGDGKLDLNVCFSWRDSTTDSVCTIRSNDVQKKGSFIDVFPGAKNMCFCAKYNVPTVSVVVPQVAVGEICL